MHALFTDLYQLTMLQAYDREGLNAPAVFDLFVRRTPRRNYLIACGLADALDFLETVRFTPEAVEYLRSLGPFEADFLDRLGRFRFTGDVYAVPEGTPVFADEPLLEVVAPIGEAQLVETFLLNQITFQTGIASKAARVVRAAQGRAVIDFGMRRMHGTDAAMKAARACYVAGAAGTSNVLAAQRYGIPASGTMAHSYVEAHDREDDAFRAFAERYPGTTLLVDTYDTLGAVRRIVELARASEAVARIGAIRLDSGDLAELAREARRILDAGGLNHVRIFASSSLDEYRIAELLAQGAPIDGFGVGTRLGTMADRPYLDSVYKLAAYAGRGRMKLSSAKSNLPGRKQVFRTYVDGRAAGDVIAADDERLDGTPLLRCVMRAGRRLPDAAPPLEAIRAHAAEALSTLPDPLFSLEDADPPYPVHVSPHLTEKTERLRRQLR